MNVYALSWCEADLDKMKLLIEFIELIWAHDGKHASPHIYHLSDW